MGKLQIKNSHMNWYDLWIYIEAKLGFANLRQRNISEQIEQV